MDFSLLAPVALVALSSAVGIAYKLLAGRGHKVKSKDVIDLAKLGATNHALPMTQLGQKATLVQFTTEYCGLCPGVRRTLSQLAYRTGGLEFCEVDITNRLDVAARFSISQTPTVFVLNSDGRLVFRVGGVPKIKQLGEELEKLGVK
jgi:thioredoxin-like negative regulator of GroEL